MARRAIYSTLNTPGRSGLMQQYANAGYWPAHALDSPASEKEHLETLARRLYILAWSIEGIAVALGLGMAISQNVPGESSFGSFLLGGGGFVMVACAELSKIPLATFFVETPRRRAKLATLGFLLLMSFITFETIFMSLERGFNARLQAVHSQKEQLAYLQAEHARLSAIVENPDIDLRSTRAAIEKQLAEIDKSLRSELDAIREERQTLLKERHQSDIPKEIEQQLNALEAKGKLLSEQRDRKITDAEDRARKTREYWQREKNIARKTNDTERELESTKRINAASSRAERMRIEAEYLPKLADVEAQAKILIDRRAELIMKIEEALKPRLSELSQLEQRTNADSGRKREELRKRLEGLHIAESSILKEVQENARKRDDVANQVTAKETEFRRIASDSQLHRIAPAFAQWWTGEHYEPHTIPETYVTTIAAIWFGSMAMLGALGGSVVAMVSQLLRKRASTLGLPDEAAGAAAEVVAAKQKFWTSLRRMLVKRKFARVRTKTVEVVKVQTQTKFVAVPVPVNAPFEKFKREYAELSASLSPSALLEHQDTSKPGSANEPTGNT